MAPFGVGSLPHDATCAPGATGCFNESLALNRLTIPAGTVLTWSFPLTPSAIGVYGYLQQSYGSSNHGPHSTPSVQIKNLNTLSSTHDVSFTGSANNYDAIYDGFLTSTAYGTNVAEFSVVVHTNAATASYVAGITLIGTMTISGIAWTVAQNGTKGGGGQILFMPSNQADILSATLDLKAMFAYLTAQGALTGNEFFNGVALGVEPYVNGGTMTTNSWSVVQN